MKALVAALERIATALEQLVPAVTQATRTAPRVSQACPTCAGREARDYELADFLRGKSERFSS